MVKKSALDNKFWDVLIIFSAFFMIALLIFVLYYSLQYWVNNYPDLRELPDQTFYIAVGIAIVTTISQWISGRIKIIMETMDKYKRAKT